MNHFAWVCAGALTVASQVAGAQTPPSPWGAPPPMTAADPYAAPPNPQWAGQAQATLLPPGAALAGAPMPPAPMPPMRCSIPSSGRWAVEMGVSFGAAAASILLPLSLVDFSREDDVLLAMGVGAVSYLFLTPLAVWSTGNALGGDGSYWATFLGNMLLGGFGAPLGYELSTLPNCPPGVQRIAPPGLFSARPTPHPRRYGLTAPPSPAHRLLPLAAPTTRGEGLLVGATLQF